MLNMRASIRLILFVSLFFAALCQAKNIDSFELPKSKLRLELDYSNESYKVYEERLITLVDTYIVEATQLFGGLPKKLDGNVYKRLRIKLTSSGFGGEADPEYIELRNINDTKLFGFLNWEIGLLHEVLHLWSAETFTYVDYREQWFNEGVTEYLTFRLATKLGLLKKEQVLNVFSTPIANYLSAKGIGELSLSSAAKTSAMKREHYFLIYHGGFVAGMILDHQIRSRSNAQFTIDDLMKGLYENHSRENKYSNDSILDLIKVTMNLDFSAFFDRHIFGSEIMPVGDYFDIGELMLNEIGVPINGQNQQVLANMLMVKQESI